MTKYRVGDETVGLINKKEGKRKEKTFQTNIPSNRGGIPETNSL